MYTQDGHGTEVAIALSIDGVDYGLDVPDIGDESDVADPIFARPGYLEYEFYVNGNIINHELSAGSNLWLGKRKLFRNV